MRTKLDHHVDYFIVIALAVLCYLMFFHSLGSIGLLGPDEPRYASVARAMFESGDYITPRLDGEIWFEKPVLMYWLAAFGFFIFGVGETGARFGSALGASISIFLIYWCGCRLFSRGVGFASALVLLSSVGFFGLARAASMDMPLTAALTAALVFLLVGMDADEKLRRWYFYGFYSAIGLGVLAKGPVAILLPGLALVAFLIWRGGYPQWRTWHPEGLIFTAVVAGPWYTAVTLANGWEFIDVFVINQNLQRFTSTIHGHEQPFYFFIPVLLLSMFPWTFLLIPALRRRGYRTWREQLVLMWAAIPFVFFSLSSSKLPAYILPMLPALALLCGREITAEKTRAFQLALVCQAALSLGIGVAFGFFGEYINIDFGIDGFLIVAISFFAAIVLIALAIWMPPQVFGGCNFLAMVIIVLVITTALFPRIQTAETMKPWMGQLGQFVSDGQTVVLYKPDRWMDFGLKYYRRGNARTVSSREELANLTAVGNRVLCIAENRMLDELSASSEIAIEVVHTIGSQVAFWAWRP